MRNAFKILAGKHERKRALEDLGADGEIKSGWIIRK
jgi:hypothetical protein